MILILFFKELWHQVTPCLYNFVVSIVVEDRQPILIKNNKHRLIKIFVVPELKLKYFLDIKELLKLL